MLAMKTRHITAENLLLFLLGEMPRKAAGSLQSHFDACASCRSRLEREKSLLRILKRHPASFPHESVLDRHRMRLMHKLKFSVPSRTAKPVSQIILNVIKAVRPYRFQWATVAAVFCAGLIAGRMVALQKDSGPASVREALQALESSSPLSGFDVTAAGQGRNEVTIRFKTIQEHVMTGRLADQNVQRALSYVLRHSPGDHVRLRTLNLLAQSKPSRDEVREALIHTLESDDNPGVRLKAIRLLIDAFPVHETVKNALIRAFFRDSNEGIRIEAANSLNRLTDPDVVPLLRQQASANPYVQSLIMKED
jgi:hypothetical protein